jgi:tRNA threonylcarbamoyladenosine biosynthesis protein TsaB
VLPPERWRYLKVAGEWLVPVPDGPCRAPGGAGGCQQCRAVPNALDVLSLASFAWAPWRAIVAEQAQPVICAIM